MRIGTEGLGHLTYCSNIHPGESWEEVRANLGRYLPAVRDRVAPEGRFGVGLRLSAAAADALAAPDTLDAFRRFLDAERLYVFTINGFPYGPFHGVPVKEAVYLPDWSDPERLRYTDLLADLMAALLPAEPDLYGSVSTVPGAFKPRVTTQAQVARMAEMMGRHAAHLADIEARTGCRVVLAVEPEPCCYIETVAEAVDFFGGHLFSGAGAAAFRDATGLRGDTAEAVLRRHLGLCLDLCHAAVEFEDPADCVAALRGAGIEIAKMQISAGLLLPEVGPQSRAALEPFADRVYLHQVVERSAAGLARFPDLPEAFASLGGNGAREWRVHFHVPIFLDDLGEFATTQPFIRAMLDLHRREPISAHLEVETYTWDVLPARYRDRDIVDAVAEELGWVLGRLGA